MKTSKLLYLSSLACAQAAFVKRESIPYQDYGELRLAVTSSYDFVYDDRGTGGRRDVSIWQPTREGFGALGTVAEATNHDSANHQRATLIAALNPDQPPADPSKPALKQPTDFKSIWTDRGSGGKYDGSFWRPECESGYVSLGDVGSTGYGKPDRPVWCLRKDLAKQATYQAKTLWDDGGSGANQDAFLWEVIPRATGVSGSEILPLYAGTFRVTNNNRRPNEAAYTLAIKAPKEFTRFSARIPKVTENTIPSRGDLYDEIEQAALVLPMTALFQPKDEIMLNYVDSPFANISKSAAWYVEGVWENDSEGKVQRTDQINYGFSETKEQSMEHQAGISVTSSAGIGVASFEVSLNYQFTYSSSTSFNEYKSYTETETFDVLPHSVAVMFCKRIRVAVALLDGTSIHHGDTLASGEFHLAGAKLT